MEEVKPVLAKRGITLYYFRYADDMRFLSNNKQALKEVLVYTKLFLKHMLKLRIKDNYQIFPVESRGIDFVGYVFYHNYTLLRKDMKQKIFKLVSSYKNNVIDKEELKIRMSSYFGWLKYCNSKNLLQKIYKKTGLHFSNWSGELKKISQFYGKYVYLVHVEVRDRYFILQFIYKGKPYQVKSRDSKLYNYLNIINIPAVICIMKPDQVPSRI